MTLLREGFSLLFSDFHGIFVRFLRDYFEMTGSCFLVYTVYAPQKKGNQNMLTRNYWKIFGAIMPRLSGNTYSATVKIVDGTTLTETMLASTAKPYTILGAIAMPKTSSLYGAGTTGTWYGKGTTPATIDDYALEDPITDDSLSITCGGASALVRAEGPDHYRISAAHQVTNNTGEEITVSEIGCFGILANGGKVCMLDRTVLEEPIVIPPKETVSLEYVIKFPYGT